MYCQHRLPFNAPDWINCKSNWISYRHGPPIRYSPPLPRLFCMCRCVWFSSRYAVFFSRWVSLPCNGLFFWILPTCFDTVRYSSLLACLPHVLSYRLLGSRLPFPWEVLWAAWCGSTVLAPHSGAAKAIRAKQGEVHYEEWSWLGICTAWKGVIPCSLTSIDVDQANAAVGKLTRQDCIFLP